MFGYIKPKPCELKMRDNEKFKAYYCGVCRSLHKSNGRTASLLLSYDCVFLAIFLSALYEANVSTEEFRCILHPQRKDKYLKDNIFVDYAADVNLILLNYKFADDRRDEGSITASIGKLFYSRRFRRLMEKYETLCTKIESTLKTISLIEDSKVDLMDDITENFANMMSEIFAHSPGEHAESQIRILREAGYNIGKWIYVIDAYDDIEKDIKKNAYNPIVIKYEKKSDESVGTFKGRVQEQIEIDLLKSLERLCLSLELLKFVGDTAILENIIFEGLYSKTKEIIYNEQPVRSSWCQRRR